MNGELAQIIALVSHGNLFLHQGENLPVPDLSTNSTFQYVCSIEFARYNSKNDNQGVVVANSVEDWFRFLRSIGTTHLWNIAFDWQRRDVPEHIAVSFAGGVPIAIQADLAQGFELWYPQWKTGGQSQKPWLIEYRSLMFPHSYRVSPAKLNEVESHLRQAITQAERFARRSDVNEIQWAESFANALLLLDAPKPVFPFHQDMLPEYGFSLEAHQILAAASKAYVFGGMGSWNDMGFAQPRLQQEYQQVTEKLYSAVKRATVTASNSFTA